MRYFPPPLDGRHESPIGSVTAVSATMRAERHLEPEPAQADTGRLIRTITLPAAEARAHLAQWRSEAPSHEIPAPTGMVAFERMRADRTEPGVMRRQRILVGRGDPVPLTHWSVLEPPSAADARAWERVLAQPAPAGPPRGRAGSVWRA